MGVIISDIKFKKDAQYERGIEAIQILKDICSDQYQEDCDAGKCPLNRWCHRDREEYPCNWD